MSKLAPQTHAQAAPRYCYHRLSGSIAWWRDPSLVVGNLSAKVRKVRVRNMLIGTEMTIKVSLSGTQTSAHALSRAPPVRASLCVRARACLCVHSCTRNFGVRRNNASARFGRSAPWRANVAAQQSVLRWGMVPAQMHHAATHSAILQRSRHVANCVCTGVLGGADLRDPRALPQLQCTRAQVDLN